MTRITTYTVILMVLLTFGCKDETKVTGVIVNPEEMVLTIGETRQIELTINPTSAAIYNSKNWSSSDVNVAEVDNKGNVTAIYAGTCVITATVDGHKARCKVTVETPNYDLEMSEGSVYITGVDDETGALTQVLRLYEKELTMDEEGNVTGNGLMINLALCSPAGTDTLSEGVYIVEDSHRELTVKPGEMNEEGGKKYVTGSFLGQYTDNGLSVLLLTQGSVDIKKNNEGGYCVECRMIGAQNEIVTVTWKGKPMRYRSDSIDEPEKIIYSNMVVCDTIVEGETLTRHTSVSLTDGKTRVEMLFRLPLTTTEQLLAGHYTLSGEESSYTISAEGSYVECDNQIIDLVSANVTIKVEKNAYEIGGNIRGTNGINYVIERYGGDEYSIVEKNIKNNVILVGDYKNNQ